VFPSPETAHLALVYIHSVMSAEEAHFIFVDGMPVHVTSLIGIEVRLRIPRSTLLFMSFVLNIGIF